MNDVGASIRKVMNRHLGKAEQPCPKCGKPLYHWKSKDKDSLERCEPICLDADCGYALVKEKQELDIQQMYLKSLKRRAINRLKYRSLVPNRALLEKRLSNYEVEGEEQHLAKETALRAVEQFLKKEPVHLVYSGKCGVGKSHLAMGVAWEVLERSDYQLNVLFISWPDVLEKLKRAIKNEELRKKIQEDLLDDVKLFDLVILDDIGAEISSSSKKDISDYDYSTLNRIVEARQDLATVFTTNLTGKKIREAYDDRVLSRILNHSQGYKVLFNETRDRRLGT